MSCQHKPRARRVKGILRDDCSVEEAARLGTEISGYISIVPNRWAFEKGIEACLCRPDFVGSRMTCVLDIALNAFDGALVHIVGIYTCNAIDLHIVMPIMRRGFGIPQHVQILASITP